MTVRRGSVPSHAGLAAYASVHVELVAPVSALRLTVSKCVLAQPPLDRVPDGDWYCATCIADGKASRPAKQARSRKGKQKAPPPAQRAPGNRALAAMLSDDEDSQADGAVSVKVLGENNR